MGSRESAFPDKESPATTESHSNQGIRDELIRSSIALTDSLQKVTPEPGRQSASYQPDAEGGSKWAAHDMEASKAAQTRGTRSPGMSHCSWSQTTDRGTSGTNFVVLSDGR